MVRLLSRYSPGEIRVASADARLVEAACRGDQTAFGRLYEQYAAVVHGLLLAKVPREEADDLVQEVFLLPCAGSRRSAIQTGLERGCRPLRATWQTTITGAWVRRTR